MLCAGIFWSILIYCQSYAIIHAVHSQTGGVKMICKKCKQKINKDESVCPHCGEPIKASFIHRAISSLKQMADAQLAVRGDSRSLAFLIAMAVFAL